MTTPIRPRKLESAQPDRLAYRLSRPQHFLYFLPLPQGQGLLALDTDVDELFLLANKIPEPIRQRVIERPDAFRKGARII